MQTSFPDKVNYYNVLKVSTTATLAEIKKARNKLALEMHGDKGGNDEVMKIINAAFNVLSQPELRKKYDLEKDDDNDYNASILSGFLHVGRKLSEEWVEKINFWKNVDPSQDKTLFRNPNSVNGEVLKSPHPSSPLSDCQNLLRSAVPLVDQSLSLILPKEIWTWSFTKIKILKKEILNSSLWSAQLPPEEQEPKPLNINYNQHIQQVNALLNAPIYDFVIPDIRNITQTVLKHYSTVSKSILPSTDRHPAGTLVTLCPNPPAMQGELGYIPTHTVNGNSVTLKTDAADCNDCKQPFGIFLWKSNCMLCGNVNCNDCLTVRKVPDYIEPVQVCHGCDQDRSQSYKLNWTSPLDNPAVRQTVTRKYLALLDELGYANQADFLNWADLFFEEGRYDLAIQCTYSGCGDWMALAFKMAEKQRFSEAKRCLHLIQNQSKQWWIAQGDVLATHHPTLALLCYQRGGLNPQEYINKAIQFCNDQIAKKCLITAAKQSQNEQTLFTSAYEQAIKHNKYDLAIFCVIQANLPLNKWITIINEVDIQFIEPFIQSCNTIFRCNWNKICLKPDRDHFRWQFLGKPDFKLWLGYLEQLLKQDFGQYSIPYFRSKMRNENFIIHRDDYLASGDYSKMLLCHCLIHNQLAWKELAQKLRCKDESACLAAYLCDADPIEEIGDQVSTHKHFSLALRCYLQAGNSQKIKELLTKLSNKEDAQTRLLYQFVLWKNEPENSQLIIDICRLLLTNPANAKSIQNIVIACLKKMRLVDNLSFYKVLIQTGISDKELLGLLERISSLPLNSTDQAWYNQTLASFQTTFKTSLRLAIYHCSLKEVFSLIDLFHPFTVTTIQELLKELKVDRIERGPLKSVCLIVNSLSNLINPTSAKLLEAMNDLTEAMLGDPSEDSMNFYSKTMEKISAYTMMDEWKLRGKEIENVTAPEKSEFKDRLRRTPNLKMIIRSEEAIEKFKPFDAAMSYIDLCMAIGHAPGLVGGFLSAALSLLKAMQESKNNPHDCFAYRKAIVELVTTAYTLGHARLCPATRLHALRSSIAILTAAFKQSPTISAHEQMVIEVLYEEADKLSQVAPIIMNRLLQIYDGIYLDCIYRGLMKNYLDNRRKSDSNPIYQYYLLEGTFQGWLDEEQFSFEEERVNSMQALLQKENNTMDDVEQLMSWPAISRDSEGWLPPKPMPLKLVGQKKYARVNGIRFNIDTGEISLLLEESSDPMKSLFDDHDITDVMKLGVGGAQFTLDPPEPSDMPFHPFQKMLFAPECLEGTNYLATMLHADMLMKWLSQMIEVSGMAPFALRDAEEGLLKRLPNDLRKKFTDLRDNLPSTAGKIHRFWIQAGDLPYFQTQKDNVITFTFGKGNMSVKKHRMVRDREGKLVDTEKDEETNSREAKFAKLMTDEYENLGKYFPELARLEELVKLQALSTIAQDIYAKVQNMMAKINVSREEIGNCLSDIRSQIDYPKINQVDTIVDQCIKGSGYSRSQISSNEITKLRNDIWSQCNKADNQRVQQIVTLLNQKFHNNYLENSVRYWLNTGNNYGLVTTLKESLEEYERSKILRICNTFKTYGIASETKIASIQNKCSWVPAAYRITDHHRIYGGVNMNARLIPGGAVERSMGINSLPPRGGPLATGPNSKPYYVEGMGPYGQLYGTMTGVDRVTGNTYRIVDVGSCIRDQYNQNYSRPNVTAFWGTYVGYTDVHHYTRHTNGATHFHYTSGWTNCTNAQGTTTQYRSGDRSHRCNN